MNEIIMLILLVGQIALFAYIARKFDELKDQLIKKNTIEFRNYLNNLSSKKNDYD